MVVPEAHLCPEDVPVVSLDCSEAWAGLSENERLYAHHFSKACWAGAQICAEQVSSESRGILDLIFHLASSGVASHNDEAHFSLFLDYACFCVGNLGNYKNIGDAKVFPRLPAEAFGAIVERSGSAEALRLWEELRERIYSADKASLNFGFPPEGSSAYYAGGVTQEEAETVNRFLAASGDEPWNTRLAKSGGILDVRRASAGPVAEVSAVESFEDCLIQVSTGDHAAYLPAVIEHLQAAKEFASEQQQKMIDLLVQHFATGDIALHKAASAEWVRDSSPSIETTIGFIESDRDPAGVRAEFEGFVAVVNQEVSRKFGTLVSRAEELLERLPWGPGFEKDRFIRPDFTSLDVVVFCSGGLPLGICLPNYDDVRTEVGFKNVDLGNVCTARSPEAYELFLSREDAELFKRLYALADQVLTGLHELVGHGSGKILQVDSAGAKNYPEDLINPCTGALVATHYGPGESYGAVFGALASPLEECRAECISLYLGVDADVQAIFGFENEACEDSVYAGWLGMCWLGLKSLEYFDLEKRTWGAVHGRARYAILRHLLAAGETFLRVEVDESSDPWDCRLHMDRSMIRTIGRRAIGELLLKIHIARCTADRGAVSFFEELTEVPPEFVKLRGIVLGRQRPRDIFCQPSTALDPDGGPPRLITYPATREGVLRGFADRYILR